MEAIASHRAFLERTGQKAERERARARMQFLALLRNQLLRSALDRLEAEKGRLDEVALAISRREAGPLRPGRDPGPAARHLNAMPLPRPPTGRRAPRRPLPEAGPDRAGPGAWPGRADPQELRQRAQGRRRGQRAARVPRRRGGGPRGEPPADGALPRRGRGRAVQAPGAAGQRGQPGPRGPAARPRRPAPHGPGRGADRRPGQELGAGRRARGGHRRGVPEHRLARRTGAWWTASSATCSRAWPRARAARTGRPGSRNWSRRASGSRPGTGW